MTRCTYQNPGNFKAQRMNLLLCKLKKLFRSWGESQEEMKTVTRKSNDKYIKKKKLIERMGRNYDLTNFEMSGISKAKGKIG